MPFANAPPQFSQNKSSLKAPVPALELPLPSTVSNMPSLSSSKSSVLATPSPSVSDLSVTVAVFETLDAAVPPVPTTGSLTV